MLQLQSVTLKIPGKSNPVRVDLENVKLKIFLKDGERWATGGAVIVVEIEGADEGGFVFLSWSFESSYEKAYTYEDRHE